MRASLGPRSGLERADCARAALATVWSRMARITLAIRDLGAARIRARAPRTGGDQSTSRAIASRRTVYAYTLQICLPTLTECIAGVNCLVACHFVFHDARVTRFLPSSSAETTNRCAVAVAGSAQDDKHASSQNRAWNKHIKKIFVDIRPLTRSPGNCPQAPCSCHKQAHRLRLATSSHRNHQPQQNFPIVSTVRNLCHW